MANLPLEGIRVVDIAVIWAASYTAWLLGTLGAEVIHIDNPFYRLDRARGFTVWTPPRSVFAPVGGGHPAVPGDRPWNVGLIYFGHWWNRKACSINLNSPEGIEVCKRLIAKSDIFLENNSAHAMESLGLGHEELMELNSRLICINMPGWGRSGPYRDYVGVGAIHEAIGGEEWLRGYPDEDHPAHNIARYHMDSTGAVMAAQAAMMGLIYRRRTGKGTWVDFGQMQATVAHFGELYMDTVWNKRDQRTIGNRHPTAVQGCYRCRGPEPTLETAHLGGERWVNITINNDEEWRGFCNAIGNPDWAKNPKFADPVSRYQNHDELDRHIEAWTKQHDSFEVFYILQKHGVPAGPVEDWRDAYMDPQLNARDFFVTLSHEDAGTHRYPGFAWEFSETPLQVKNPQMRLGEHSEHVCKEIIGMSDEEYAALKAREIVGRETYPWAGPRPDYEGYAKERGIESYVYYSAKAPSQEALE